MAKITTIAAADAPKAVGPYSQARLVSGDAETLYLSGQLPINPATATMPESIEEQTEQVCKNLCAVLEAAGTSVEKAVKTTCFLAEMADFAVFNEVYGKYFTSKPARSCVEVARLPKDVLLECEVIAEL